MGVEIALQGEDADGRLVIRWDVVGGHSFGRFLELGPWFVIVHGATFRDARWQTAMDLELSDAPMLLFDSEGTYLFTHRVLHYRLPIPPPPKPGLLESRL
jgi:hypothetical protein